jgi:hypothetical protein
MILHDPDVLECVVRFVPGRRLWILALADKALLAMLAKDVRKHAYSMFTGLNLSFWLCGREWKQFKNLYRVADWRVIRRQKTRRRQYKFEFLTGLQNNWHTCEITLFPWRTGKGARLRVFSYDTEDKLFVTRTYKRIWRLSELVDIFDGVNWHDPKAHDKPRWSVWCPCSKTRFYWAVTGVTCV